MTPDFIYGADSFEEINHNLLHSSVDCETNIGLCERVVVMFQSLVNKY